MKESHHIVNVSLQPRFVRLLLDTVILELSICLLPQTVETVSSHGRRTTLVLKDPESTPGVKSCLQTLLPFPAVLWAYRQRCHGRCMGGVLKPATHSATQSQGARSRGVSGHARPRQTLSCSVPSVRLCTGFTGRARRPK